MDLYPEPSGFFFLYAFITESFLQHLPRPWLWCCRILKRMWKPNWWFAYWINWCKPSGPISITISPLWKSFPCSLAKETWRSLWWYVASLLPKCLLLTNTLWLSGAANCNGIPTAHLQAKIREHRELLGGNREKPGLQIPSIADLFYCGILKVIWCCLHALRCYWSTRSLIIFL